VDILTSALSPWGESILVRISWDLFWAALVGGILFLLSHGSYMLFSPHHKRASGDVDQIEAEHASLPTRIERHSFVARMFHWVMAFAMLSLVFTAFLPVVGVRFAWVQWHWMAGILLTGAIIFHIIHATFFMDFWSIWIGPKDLPDAKAEILRELGADVDAPKSGKYPLGNRLYHLAVLIAGLGAISSGILMMARVRTPVFERNPFWMGDAAYGLTYVVHGLTGVGFVGMIIAHIYFALRPEKFWLTKSMLFGTISRREYLEHHDPKRWVTNK
jgi:cytochrome b subunit of formate dehydrogenase